MARRRLRRERGDDDFTYVEGGRIRRIQFEGDDGGSEQEFESIRPGREEEVEFQESRRPVEPRSEEEDVIRVRDYRPRHVAPMDDIEFEVDHLNEIRAGHIPKGTPPDRTDLMRRREALDEVLYETEGGRVTRAEGPSGRVLYVDRGSALRSERFRSSLVDVIVKDVDLDEEVVIRRKIVEEAPATTKTKVTQRVSKKRKATKKAKKATSAPAKAPAKKSKKAPGKPQRSQVAVGEYKLFHAGNRYFFSKKSQAESAKSGAAPVYEIPDDRKVVKTPNGLPVLKSTKAKRAAKKPAKKAGKATSVAKKASAKEKTVAKKPVAAKPTAKKASPAAQPQCGGVTADGKQCRNSARGGSKYCASHKGYRPRTIASTQALDTVPAAKKAKDTKPTKASASKAGTPQAQCAALTADGKQCRNSSRTSSKYCGSHKGYRSTKGLAALDTKPRAKKAADTKPSIRKG